MAVTITHSTLADGTFSSTGAAAWDADHVVTGLDNVSTAAIGYTFNGLGAVLTTGTIGVGLRVPFACTINSATLQSDVSGSMVVDIWKDSYANYPPTVADSICASAKPTLSSADKSEDTTLTDWTTSIAAGDILFFNIDSCSTITNAVLTLKVTKS